MKSLALNGPSGENRTHGLLNPIQARYQNCATPGYRAPLPYRSVATRDIIRRVGGHLSTIFCNFFGYFLQKSDFYAPALFYCCAACRSALSFSSRGLRYWPVKLPGTSATCSGVPSAMIRPPALPPSGAQINDVVGALDEIEVVLDDNDGVARIHQLLQHLDQAVDIRNVQAGGGLVEDIDRLAGAAAGQLIGQLDTLRLAAGEGGSALAQRSHNQGPRPTGSATCGRSWAGWQRRPPPPPRSCSARRRWSFPYTFTSSVSRL